MSDFLDELSTAKKVFEQCSKLLNILRNTPVIELAFEECREADMQGKSWMDKTDIASKPCTKLCESSVVELSVTDMFEARQYLPESEDESFSYKASCGGGCNVAIVQAADSQNNILWQDIAHQQALCYKMCKPGPYALPHTNSEMRWCIAGCNAGIKCMGQDNQYQDEIRSTDG